MRTESEIISKLTELRAKAKTDESFEPLISLLEWVIEGDKDEDRETELFDIYRTKLKGKEKVAFNPLRRYETFINRPLTLNDIQSERIMHNLYSFGKQSREMVLKNPKDYLF